MHSLKPARYLLRTLASAESAAGGKKGRFIRDGRLGGKLLHLWMRVARLRMDICKNLPPIWTRCRFRKCLTVISRMSAFSSLECLELCAGKERSLFIFAREKREMVEIVDVCSRESELTSFFRASRMRVLSCPRLSLILALRRFSMMGLEDYKGEESSTLILGDHTQTHTHVPYIGTARTN